MTLQRDVISADDYAALAAACPTGALSLCGSAVNPDDIMAEVMRDKPFYLRSGGGLTLSGGEPFMQPEAAAELLRRGREAGIHTAVESCLHVPGVTSPLRCPGWICCWPISNTPMKRVSKHGPAAPPVG